MLFFLCCFGSSSVIVMKRGRRKTWERMNMGAHAAHDGSTNKKKQTSKRFQWAEKIANIKIIKRNERKKCDKNETKWTSKNRGRKQTRRKKERFYQYTQQKAEIVDEDFFCCCSWWRQGMSSAFSFTFFICNRTIALFCAFRFFLASNLNRKEIDDIIAFSKPTWVDYAISVNAI